VRIAATAASAEAGAQLLVHQRLADLDAGLNDRNNGLELMDGGRGRGVLVFLLRLLTRKCRDLASVGAPPRFVLDRANSTGNGVSTPRFRSAATSSAAISLPGLPINDPKARIPIRAILRFLPILDRRQSS
jgi:hypothetical protein